MAVPAQEERSPVEGIEMSSPSSLRHLEEHVTRPYRPTLLGGWMRKVLGNGYEEPSKDMIRKMVALALPTIVANVIWFMQQTLAQSYVGRRGGDEALAQWTVGISIHNVAGLSLGIGLASALDTLASQAYGRSATNPELGELLQRSILVDIVVSAPLVVLFQFTRPILEPVYGEELARGASQVLAACWLYLPLNIINNSIIKALQAQNLPQLQLYGNIIGVVACWLVSHFYIDGHPAGGAVALSAACVAQFVALVMLCYWHPSCALRHSTWPIHPKLFDIDAMNVYLTVGVPSLVSMCAEWWAFELLIVFAARVSDMQVTILSVCLSTTVMCFSVALGVSVAGSVCIGNALGDNKPQQAKSYFVVSLVMDQIVTCGTVAAILLGRFVIPTWYTTDPNVADTFAHIAFVVALKVTPLRCVIHNVPHKAPRPFVEAAAKAALLSLWMVGVPLSWFFGVHLELGTKGIMLGLVGGFCVEVPLLIHNATSSTLTFLYRLFRPLSLEEVAHHHPVPSHDVDEDEDFEAHNNHHQHGGSGGADVVNNAEAEDETNEQQPLAHMV
ncbi:membrane transporter, putative [Bodo saltans]|uniref:Membrane transporter, putative n=1 Tax=Bodo saltans TaxID=75058 RepID=A0A0S4JV01_BODSA|nr:membrane transporter, putative [Bodo saltans]|eukprot:CUG94058.1 membrane transporter, putative [Bodo saltans]